jgi:hypothetical protein
MGIRGILFSFIFIALGQTATAKEVKSVLCYPLYSISEELWKKMPTKDVKIHPDLPPFQATGGAPYFSLSKFLGDMPPRMVRFDNGVSYSNLVPRPRILLDLKYLGTPPRAIEVPWSTIDLKTQSIHGEQHLRLGFQPVFYEQELFDEEAQETYIDVRLKEINIRFGHLVDGNVENSNQMLLGLDQFEPLRSILKIGRDDFLAVDLECRVSDVEANRFYVW